MQQNGGGNFQSHRIAYSVGRLQCFVHMRHNSIACSAQTGSFEQGKSLVRSHDLGYGRVFIYRVSLLFLPCDVLERLGKHRLLPVLEVTQRDGQRIQGSICILEDREVGFGIERKHGSPSRKHADDDRFLMLARQDSCFQEEALGGHLLFNGEVVKKNNAIDSLVLQ